MFSTKEYSTKSGLYYFGARYYDPKTGRWTQKDPLGIFGGSLNLYQYCLNNPVNLCDPYGYYWFRQSWQTDFVVGRDKTIVPPGSPISRFIEDYLPAGRTFGEMHDAFVGTATNAGLPDCLVNIPSMIPMYEAALIAEMLRSFRILEQQKRKSK